jgi:predicted porin
MKARRTALTLGALAAMTAGVASAQSPLTYSTGGANFTLYGNVDYYLNYMRSSSGSDIVALQDGAYLRTRIGVRGDKELAKGYTAKFTVEQGLNDTSGAQADATRLFDRQLWAGLATGIGEFRVGRQNTAVFYRGGYIDNTTRTLGSVINAFGVPSRYDSDFAYLSPRLAGFMFEGHYSIAGSAVDSTSNQSVYQLALDYEYGPFRVGYAGLAGKPPTGAPVDESVQYHNVYANWNYGSGKVYLAYVRSNNNGPTAGTVGTLNNGASPLSNVGSPLLAGTDNSVLTYYNIYQASADYQITKELRIGALYGVIDDTSPAGKNADGWAVSTYYDIFKDTIVYFLVNQIRNDPNAGFRPAGSAGLTKTFTTANDVNGRTITGVQLGFVYRF